MAPETLYNSIELPAVWPPRSMDENSLEPAPVPYLEDGPAAIDIDLGRQLFVDDFLIESTNLTRIFLKPHLHPASPILEPATAEELDAGNCPMAAPFNDGICYDDSDHLFKLWYMPGWFHSTALATSTDGIHWQRPELDVVPGTNLVWPNHPEYDRDGCLVWLDHGASDPRQRFKMFQYYRFTDAQNQEKNAGWLHTSSDGVHWSAPLTTTPVGDNTSFFYNPFRRKWCTSVRRSTPLHGRRARWYRESDDFLAGAAWDVEAEEVFWQRTDHFDRPDPERPHHTVVLYDLNATPYESLMLGAFAIFRGPENDVAAAQAVPKIIDLELGYSRDGFHFSRPDRTPFLASTRRPGDWNRGYLHAAGGLCTVVGDELFFYFGAFSALSPRLGPGDTGEPGRTRHANYAGASTGLATLRRDGFAAMEAGSSAGELTTRPLLFNGRHLFVNLDNPRGELRAAVLECDNTPVPGLGAAACRPLAVDSTCAALTWSSGSDLAKLAGRPLKLRFELQKGRLFSFWITDDPGGASYGYGAAGGPGFTAARDLPDRQI